MHIPDNYLSPATCAVFGAAMLPVLKKSADKVKSELSREKLPMLAVSASFSFLIMMFNLPMPGGTTGHAVGAALIAILLGPWSAAIAVTVALAIQALLFGDGGILALGANAFNMAFVMPFAAHYIFRLLKGIRKDGKFEYAAAFIAAYTALNLAALCAAVEFGVQPLLFRDAAGMPLYCPYGLSVSVPAMLLPHLLVAGFVEGFVTLFVYSYVKKLSPEIIYKSEKLNFKPLYILIAAMIVLSPLGLLATGTAWGEWGAEELNELVGFIPQAFRNGSGFNALMPGYTVAGSSNTIGYVMSAIAGIVLIVVVFRLFAFRQSKAMKK